MARKYIYPNRSTGTSTLNVPKEDLPGAEDAFDPALISEMQALANSGLNPASILNLLGRLIAEVPSASKENMDRIKIMDKLLNTARSIMETTLKHDKAVAIMKRLDELEEQMERVAAEQTRVSSKPQEIWKNRESDA